MRIRLYIIVVVIFAARKSESQSTQPNATTGDLAVASNAQSTQPNVTTGVPGAALGQVSAKASVPTAEQILGKLLGMASQSAPAPAPAPLYPLAQQQLFPGYPYSNTVARSQNRPGAPPLLNSLLSGNRPTPQTEDNPGPQPVYPPNPPEPYSPYGRRGRKHPDADDPPDDEEEGAAPDGSEDDAANPADEEYNDERGRGRRLFGRRRRLGERGLGRNRQEGGCCSCNICWKGIKPHVEWVRVPVCYHPCGICCPKHEEQGACPCIMHPCHHCCCHHCCHCCHCCHPCCHCCHCCHCCRRSQTEWRAPLVHYPKRFKKFSMKIKTKKSKKYKKKTNNSRKHNS
ncbi:uncharacterized protein LOC116618393 [Nematostella vectensis]|uniref:uncharacterized protein LOC116618393 n=1 Tax=Nematostella vectensis TaxID=45351 RepID=UPI002076FD94|nr:uncharacterized protein LOC116618393 [Nematostella vectensis]XP_032237872.2 uncharacterized protein LOC116618393 [Nematostella vectensis]